MSQSRSCQFKDSCPIYAEFREYQKHMYVGMYCNDHFELCARRKLRTKGEPVPANLSPNGLFLMTNR
jgi:hypothetical protein